MLLAPKWPLLNRLAPNQLAPKRLWPNGRAKTSSTLFKKSTFLKRTDSLLFRVNKLPFRVNQICQHYSKKSYTHINISNC